jgi:hypothetical protein
VTARLAGDADRVVMDVDIELAWTSVFVLIAASCGLRWRVQECEDESA